MAIQWFPGHMHKARKEIKKALRDIDLVIEILDARIPFSSANPMIKQLAQNKPIIKLLNKADLADEAATEVWQQHFSTHNQTRSLALSANDSARKSTIIELARKLVPMPTSIDGSVRAMIMGIPNVGKSTFINAMVGSAMAKVGNEPAVTKRQQKIRISDTLTICDTPGMLWPKLEPDTCGYRLAASGAVRDTAMDYEPVALFTLSYLRAHYPDALKERYRLEALPDDNDDMLNAIGAKRGCLRSGGIVDLHAASTVLLQDLRSGKLGRITLENPDMMAAELTQLRAEIAAKKALQDEQQADSSAD